MPDGNDRYDHDAEYGGNECVLAEVKEKRNGEVSRREEEAAFL